MAGDKLQIRLFGAFEILVNGNAALGQLRQAKKTCLFLEYLILKRDAAVPHQELLDMLWSERDSRNPATALRTLLHRYRSIVEAAGIPELSDSVVTLRGAYRWNPALKCTIDIYEFERLCRAAQQDALPADERIYLYEQALSLYTAPLLVNARDETWVVQKSVYYHDLYFDSLLTLFSLLREKGAYARIVLLCRKAMDVDCFDERLQYELMMALVKTGQKSEALVQYQLAADAPLPQADRQPEQMRDAYHSLLAADAEMEADLDGVRAVLEGTAEDEGAFECSYDILQDIYLLQRRMTARFHSTLFLGLLALRTEQGVEMSAIEHERVMQRLLAAAKRGLRCGDTVSRYSITQCVVLLPGVTYETGKQVLDRVRRDFYTACDSPCVMLSYKLRPLRTAGPEGENT